MRTCANCGEHLPAETKHIYSEIDDAVYCTDCVEVVDYTETAFYVDGEYIGDTAQENCKVVESYDDEYEVAE